MRRRVATKRASVSLFFFLFFLVTDTFSVVYVILFFSVLVLK